jgi:S-adenosylmethionine decarboxylase
VKGTKLFIDHKINSIENYVSKDTKERYQMIDVNVYQENIFHTKMMLKDFELDNYLFGVKSNDLNGTDEKAIRQRLQQEMLEIFYGRNIAK